MLSEKEKTWLQCQHCGYLYQTDAKVGFDLSIIDSVCPRCEYERALNCGNDEDIYRYYNTNLDERYY